MIDTKLLREKIEIHATAGWRAELEGCAAEIDALRAHLETAEDALACALREKVRSRALAMEEAALAAAPNADARSDRDELGNVADRIRALAPMPRGLVAVERKLLEDAKATICSEFCGPAQWHSKACVPLAEVLKR